MRSQTRQGPTALTIFLGGVAFCVGACASHVPPPHDQWAAAQEDVGRADAAGASNVPDAKLHMELAQEDLRKAKGLMGGDNRRAASLSALASAEAQLAYHLARQQSAEAVAQQADSELRKATGK